MGPASQVSLEGQYFMLKPISRMSGNCIPTSCIKGLNVSEKRGIWHCLCFWHHPCHHYQLAPSLGRHVSISSPHTPPLSSWNHSAPVVLEISPAGQPTHRPPLTAALSFSSEAGSSRQTWSWRSCATLTRSPARPTGRYEARVGSVGCC